jgi:hypothetical protein
MRYESPQNIPNTIPSIAEALRKIVKIAKNFAHLFDIRIPAIFRLSLKRIAGRIFMYVMIPLVF